MGLVYSQVGTWVKPYSEKTEMVKEAVVTPGQDRVSLTLEDVSREEVDLLAKKLDVLANQRQNEAIAAMVAKSFPAILTAMRWVKVESAQEFRGMKAMGKQLDICWLRPEDVGGSILNTAGTASKGLYGGTSAEVYTWKNKFTAGTADDIIPEQTMKDEAAVIHLGAIDPVSVPKVNRIGFKVSGQRTPDQSLAYSHLNGTELSLQEFEYPVLVGPKQKQEIELDAHISGDDKTELLTLLIAQAEDLAFTWV